MLWFTGKVKALARFKAEIMDGNRECTSQQRSFDGSLSDGFARFWIFKNVLS